MILLTDGENNRGEVDPVTAARAAAAYGIRTYTIGVGSEGVAPVPIGPGPLGTEYANMRVRLDEDLLRRIAAITGGQYFRATNARALEEIYQHIDELEKTPVNVRRYVEFSERFRPFVVLAGLLLLGVSGCYVRGATHCTHESRSGVLDLAGLAECCCGRRSGLCVASPPPGRPRCAG